MSGKTTTTIVFVVLAPVAVGLGVVMGILLLIAPASASCGGGTISRPGPSKAPGVPQQLLPLYEGAAAKYQLGPDGWAYLAAINQVETDFGQNLSTSSAGAVGWMQFEPGTWAQYGITPSGAPAPYGPAGWNDPGDAIYSAANYLHASGAPGDWQGAIYSYNHAAWYVAQVTAEAQQYQRAAGQPVTAGQGTPATSTTTSVGTPTGPGVAPPPVSSGGCMGAVSGPTTPGAVAQILPNGIATIPQNAPPQVQAAIAAGNRIIATYYSQERNPNMLTQEQDSYDCSGSTDWILANAGLSSPVVDVGGGVAGDSSLLEQYGQAQAGRWITVYANPGHTFIDIAGVVMDTAWYAPVHPQSVPDTYPPGEPANAGPASGPRWQPASIIPAQIHGDTYGWFIERHPPGL